MSGEKAILGDVVYTSARRTSAGGGEGFGIVFKSGNLLPSLLSQLELISDYPYGGGRSCRPVVYSHVMLQAGGAKYHVVSRIADAGVDHTFRTGVFLAHHVVFDADKVREMHIGPAAVLQHEGFMIREWDERARRHQLSLPSAPRDPRRVSWRTRQIPACRAWENEVGDAGFAGLFADAVMEEDRRAVIVFPAGHHSKILNLVSEVEAILDPADRWDATFNTHCAKLIPGVECRWCCYLDGTAEAAEARKRPPPAFVDLSQPPPEPPSANLWVRAARDCRLPDRLAQDLERRRWRMALGAGRPGEEPPVAFPDPGQDETPAPWQPPAAESWDRWLWGLVAAVALLVAAVVAWRLVDGYRFRQLQKRNQETAAQANAAGEELRGKFEPKLTQLRADIAELNKRFQEERQKVTELENESRKLDQEIGQAGGVQEPQERAKVAQQLTDRHKRLELKIDAAGKALQDLISSSVDVQDRASQLHEACQTSSWDVVKGFDAVSLDATKGLWEQTDALRTSSDRVVREARETGSVLAARIRSARESLDQQKKKGSQREGHLAVFQSKAAPAPARPQVPDDPLRGLPDALALPSPKTLKQGDTGARQLAAIDPSVVGRLDFSLRGKDVLGGGRGFIAERQKDSENREETPNRAAWKIFQTTAGATGGRVEVATLTLSTTGLWFAWEPNRGTSIDDRQLQYCKLQAKVGQKTKDLQLYETSCKTWTLVFEKSPALRHSFSLNPPPANGNVLVEIGIAGSASEVLPAEPASHLPLDSAVVQWTMKGRDLDLKVSFARDHDVAKKEVKTDRFSVLGLVVSGDFICPRRDGSVVGDHPLTGSRAADTQGWLERTLQDRWNDYEDASSTLKDLEKGAVPFIGARPSAGVQKEAARKLKEKAERAFGKAKAADEQLTAFRKFKEALNKLRDDKESQIELRLRVQYPEHQVELLRLTAKPRGSNEE